MRLSMTIAALLVLAVFSLAQQNAEVRAEALGQANLRAGASIDAQLVGEITAGASYPVLGRSQFYPWLLIGEPDTHSPKGWVYEDLVTVRGNIYAVPFSDLVLNAAAPVPTTASAPNQRPFNALATATELPPTATSGGFGVVGEVKGEVNIRYGPGIDYPRVGVAFAGERYEITGYHTQVPWVRIRFADIASQQAWIARDLLEISGGLSNAPAITQLQLNLPTLTATAAVITASGLAGQRPIPLGAEFQALGNDLWDLMLEHGFDPAASRFGALFVMDLQTGEAFVFGGDFAFSGTSINKIGILAALYRTLEAPPDVNTATDIANTMICSENVATNRLLSRLGGGDPYLGAEAVTSFYRQLGLPRSFLTAPFTTIGTPEPPPRPILLPQTSADQISANPDLSNQMTVADTGALLAGVYQCAYREEGVLIDVFGGAIDARECRQMLHVMSSNTVDALLKAGAPADVRVAHKHGWIPDTHGNAALFFTPGGDYVITMMLFQPEWLNFQESLPVIAEVSRRVYNYFNPDQPQDAIRDGFIPEAENCNYIGDPLVADLMQPVWLE